MVRGLAHVPAFERAPQPVMDHGVDGLLVTVFPAAARAKEEIWRLTHAFHAAGHEHVRVPRPDRLGGEHDGFETRTAHLVDRDGRGGVRKACLERSVARGILADARLQNVPHDHFVYLFRRYPRTFQGLADGDGAELRRTELGESAEIFADWRARRGQDQGVGHSYLLLLGDGTTPAYINYKPAPRPNNAGSVPQSTACCFIRNISRRTITAFGRLTAWD